MRVVTFWAAEQFFELRSRLSQRRPEKCDLADDRLTRVHAIHPPVRRLLGDFCSVAGKPLKPRQPQVGRVPEIVVTLTRPRVCRVNAFALLIENGRCEDVVLRGEISPRAARR